MTGLFALVALQSGFTFHEPRFVVIKQAIHWLFFTFVRGPDINTVAHTSAIVAGVTWSLPYEWFFYFTLPVLALLTRAVPPKACLAIGVLSIVALCFWHPNLSLLASFSGGIAAAYLVKMNLIKRVAANRFASLLVVACFAAGTDIFTLLTRPVSRFLGEQAYSIYLLHGIVLFVTMTYAIDKTTIDMPTTYWLAVVVATPVLICLTFATYRTVELPAISLSKRLFRSRKI